MPLPLQVIQENIKDFKDKYESIDLALLTHKAFDGFNRQENAIPEVFDWHKSSLIALIDALIDSEKENKLEKSERCYHCGGKGNTLKCIGATDWKFKDAYNDSKQETIGRLQALKEEINKL